MDPVVLSLENLSENILYQITENWNLEDIQIACARSQILEIRLCNNDDFWRNRYLGKFGNLEDTLPLQQVNWKAASFQLERGLAKLQAVPLNLNSYGYTQYVLTRNLSTSNLIDRTIYRRYVLGRNAGQTPEQTRPIQLYLTRRSQLIQNIQQNWVDLPEAINGYDPRELNQMAHQNLNDLSRAQLVGLNLIIEQGGYQG